MSVPVTAAGLLGLACLLSGAAVAAATASRAVARAGASSDRELRPSVRSSFDVAWMVRLAPAAGAALGWLVASLLGAIVGLIGGAVGPPLWRRRRRVAREALLEDQLAEAVSSLSAGLRAGLSLTRAISFSAQEADEPLSSSLATVADRTDLGVPLETALADWAAGAGSADARLLAGVLDLHRRTGGELPTVLDAVAVTLRERRAAAREVRALTAQARLSGAILGLLPIGFFLFLAVTSRDDITAAFRSPAGVAAIAVGFTLQGLAFVWIRALLRVDA